MAAVMQTRSRRVEIPSGLSLPLAFLINTRLIGSGWHDCSDCFRLEQNRRVGLSPTGKRRLCTAHTL